MELELFLHHLHFSADKVKPPDWEVDWENAPLAFKLYRGLPAFPLSHEVPLTLVGQKPAAKPDVREFGHFLWYVYGLNRLSHSIWASDAAERPAMPALWCRRFVPSGGGLYPNELYVYLKLDDLPVGVYHYDVAHHRLVLLREGNFDGYLDRALGRRCDMASCFGAVFVTTLFWKNVFKYNHFAYRLQGLDAGVLIGQMLEVAKRFGYDAGVCFMFLDRAVNHLVGLDEREESVYAAIPLSAESASDRLVGDPGENGTVAAADLCRELPAVRHVYFIRSRNPDAYPLIVGMNEASFLETWQPFRGMGAKRFASSAGPETVAPPSVALPAVDRLEYDLAFACRKRYSPESDFVPGDVGARDAAVLLKEATASFAYRNDLDGFAEHARPRVCLYGVFHGVEGIPDGAYRYDRAVHALCRVSSGDFRRLLQGGMSLQNVNLFRVPICLHVVGDKNHLKAELGYRGYRIAQMEAGMLVQRILLAASAVGMGGHPLLDFSADLCDGLYNLAPLGTTCLIQVPVGRLRRRPRLEANLHG